MINILTLNRINKGNSCATEHIKKIDEKVDS